MRVCVINLATSIVDNVVVLGLPQPANVIEHTSPPEGFAFVESDVAGAGWSYSNGVFTAPAPAPQDPAPPTPPSPRAWLERLSPQKQAAVAAGGIANAQILLWLLKASGSTTIDVTLQETKDGVAALVAAGVFTADDQALLLAP